MSTEASSRESRLGLVAVGILLLQAIAVHVLAPVLAWRWAQQPFVGAMLQHTLVVAVTKLPWTGVTSGLALSDRIVEVNGRPVYTRHDLERALDQLSSDAPVVLTVARPDPQRKHIEQTLELTILPQPFPVADFFGFFVLPYLVGLTFLSIGCWALWHSRGQSKPKWFALSCAGASVLITVTFDALTTHAFIRIWMACWALTSISVFHLAITFHQEIAPRHRIWQWAILLGVVALMIWTQVRVDSTDPRSYVWSQAVNYAVCAGSAVAFVGTLLRIRLRPSVFRLRLQAQVVLLGTLGATGPLALWAVAATIQALLPTTGTLVSFQPTLVFPLLVLFPVSVVYAIQRYPFLDVDLLFNPFDSSWRSYRTALRDFSREMTSSLDLDHILDRLLECVGDLLRPTHAAVLIVSERTGNYAFHRAWGAVDTVRDLDVSFGAQDGVIARLQRSGESLLLEPATLQELGSEEQVRLRKLAAALIVPIRSQDHLLGMLAVGAIKSGDTYARDDIALLGTMADQAAVALENALFYARQVEQERRLLEQTRQLTNILALGNELKSLDREIVVQETVDTIHTSLGFGLVTLSVVEEDDPTRVRVVAWAGIESTTWERLASRSFPLIDPEVIAGVQRLGDCYFVHAAATEPEISTAQKDVLWTEGDQLFVPLTSNEGLLGYLTVDNPADGLRPTEDKLEVLEIFANQAAIAMQNANLYASIDRALDERVAELATLQEFDRQINLKLDFQHVMDMTLDWAMRLTTAVAGTLSLVAKDQRSLQIAAHRGYSEEIAQLWQTPWPVDEGIIGQVIRSAQPVMMPDVTQDSEYVDAAIAIYSHLAVPITREDQVIGVVSLESNEPQGFSADHLAFLTRLADHAAIAIENVVLYEETSRRVAELTALQKISLDLTSRLNLGAVLESVAANTLQLTQADQIAIYLYDEHQDALTYGTGLSQRGKEDHPPVPIDQNQVAVTVARQGQPIVVGDARQHPLLSRLHRQVSALASIPLRKADHVLGVFDISFRDTHTFTEEELRALNLLADQAAVAVENAQFYAAAQQATEAKGEFVGIVSRALKSPMTSIQGYARLLTVGAGGPLSDQQREFADVILRNVERMDGLVSDLLELSRIEAGNLKLALRPISLARLLNDIVRTLRDGDEPSRSQVSIDIPEDLPNVHADPTRIAQIWTQLLEYALRRASQPGRVRVWAERRASLEMDSHTELWLLCAVQVPGMVLEPDEGKGIFEPLYWIGRSEAANEHGTGLELPIARGLIELHQGHIWIEDERAGGSTFFFTLPGTLDSAE